MSRIEDIIASEAYYEASQATQNYFDFVYDLVEDYDRYDADMRISGLYYRTSTVDIDKMYEITQFTKFGNDCDIQRAIEILTQPTKRKLDNKSYLDQFDYVFEKLTDKGLFDYPFEQFHWLTFEREPNNKYDENAIKVLYQDVHCGYIPKEHAAVISKKFSASKIREAIGIVGKKIGDARVTFDLFFPKSAIDKAKKVSKMRDEAEEWDEEEIDWEEEYHAVKDDFEEANKAKAAKVEPVKEEEKGLYEGQIRSNEALGYTEEWFKGKWVPWDKTSRFDKDTYKIMVWHRVDNEWREQTKEEQEASNKAVAEFCDRMKKEAEEKAAADKAVTPAYVDSNVVGLTYLPPMAEKPTNPAKGMMHMTVNGGAEIYTGTQWAPLASPVFVGTPTAPVNTTQIATTAFVSSIGKARKPIPVPLDYTQYTGFMRTVLEYATFAHVR